MRIRLFKKFSFFFLFFSVAVFSLNAQVTTNGGSGLATTYTSLDAAITALNAATITSPVVITLTASNPQTAPVGGYEIRAEGSSTNTIRIVGNGNTITASNTLTAGALNDGIFKIIGGDFITLEGFVMTENAANTTTAAATNNMTEWGVALLYTTASNGSQNNTIKGCTIDLDRTYQNTFGIYSNSNHTATVISTAAPASNNAGGNNGLTIIGNTITDINIGIVVIGPSPSGLENDGLTIGGSLANANTISNFGTTGTFSSYSNVSGTVNGILLRFVKNITVSYNSITSSEGGTTAGTLRAIFMPAANITAGVNTNTISNNTISLKSGIGTGVIQGIFVEAKAGNKTTTLNIDNNSINNLTHVGSGSGAITGIINTDTALNISISNNSFNNITTITTGSFTFISNSILLPAGGTQTINGNSIVTAFSKTGDGGSVTLFTTTSNSPTGTTSTSNGNNFSNITVVGATTITGWINRDGASTASGPTKAVTNNTFSNWTAGTGSITALTINASAAGSIHSGNTVSNISTGGALVGISILSNENGTLSGNNVNGLTTSGAVSVSGIVLSGTASANSPTVQKNKVYNIQATNSAGNVNGILISYSGNGAICNIANNIIGDLKATAANNDLNDVVRGISITATTTLANFNVYYNTIYINATSTGANFGTSGIYHVQNATATTAQLELKNNIVVNTSTAAGLGTTAAFRRSATGLENYATTSNNNIFYAGTPSASNVIYHNGTPYQTLTDFKNLVTARETNSKTENVPFTSTVGANSNYLHISTSVTTVVENGGTPIPGFADDFDGNTRNASTPDIGADEFTTVLPVTLANFTGTTNNGINTLSWTTVTETNNTGFELLRSTDGINFTKLAFISSKSATGNSSTSLQYEFADKNPFALSNYYRLKQIDKDGKATVSNIILLKGIKSKKLEIAIVYPNPVLDKLNLSILSTQSVKATITIVDYSGKAVISQPVQLINGEVNIQLSTNQLAKGNYVIRLSNGTEMAISKFVKQ